MNALWTVHFFFTFLALVCDSTYVFHLFGFLLTSHHFCINLCAVLSRFSRVWLFVTPWTIAHQAPLSMAFSRQEYWSGLPCFPPGGLPDPEIKPVPLISPALADGFFSPVNNPSTQEAE